MAATPTATEKRLISHTAANTTPTERQRVWLNIATQSRRKREPCVRADQSVRTIPAFGGVGGRSSVESINQAINLRGVPGAEGVLSTWIRYLARKPPKNTATAAVKPPSGSHGP